MWLFFTVKKTVGQDSCHVDALLPRKSSNVSAIHLHGVFESILISLYLFNSKADISFMLSNSVLRILQRNHETPLSQLQDCACLCTFLLLLLRSKCVYESITFPGEIIQYTSGKMQIWLLSTPISTSCNTGHHIHVYLSFHTGRYILKFFQYLCVTVS